MLLFKLLFVALLVAANGFFVAAEFALVKIRKGEVRVLTRKGRSTAKAVDSILTHLDAYLSACQLGITFASLGLGWIGEPAIAHTLEPMFHRVSMPDHVLHTVSFLIAFSAITFLHITIGEQVPKIMAIQRYKRTALAISLPLIAFYKVFRPFIWLLNESSNWMLRGIGMQSGSGHGNVPSEDELRLLMMESAHGGYVTAAERRIMENALDLEDKVARRYMTPRSQMDFISLRDATEDTMKKIVATGHTRYPMCDGDLDAVTGVLHVKDLLKQLSRGTHVNLPALIRPPYFVPEYVTLDVLMKEFRRRKVHMALVVDEHGGLSGMITLENVLEQLVGPIQDEFDREPILIREIEPGRFEIDAGCPVDRVERTCGIKFDTTTADTLGGALIELLGHIPVDGESYPYGTHLLEVIDATPTKITRIRVSGPPPGSRQPTTA